MCVAGRGMCCRTGFVLQYDRTGIGAGLGVLQDWGWVQGGVCVAGQVLVQDGVCCRTKCVAGLGVSGSGSNLVIVVL